MAELIWCSKCDMYNCADHVTDAGARFDQSIQEPTVERGPTTYVGSAIQIESQFPGACAGCGKSFEAGTPIRRDTSQWDGWRAECCW